MIDVCNFMDGLFATERSIRAIIHTGYSLWLEGGSRPEGPPNQRKIPQPRHAAVCVASSIAAAARIFDDEFREVSITQM
jgi:hypothetical protein